ncbi:MAG: hypothetical protein R2911_02250 [Caldilineaceae bacterium]
MNVDAAAPMTLPDQTLTTVTTVVLARAAISWPLVRRRAPCGYGARAELINQ